MEKMKEDGGSGYADMGVMFVEIQSAPCMNRCEVTVKWFVYCVYADVLVCV